MNSITEKILETSLAIISISGVIACVAITGFLVITLYNMVF
jgi:hypothetical protein